MASKNVIKVGAVERAVDAVLRRLSVDATGRLRVGDVTITSGGVGSCTTVTTLTNLTNWGLCSATAKSQWESQQAFQAGYRRNLVHT